MAPPETPRPAESDRERVAGLAHELGQPLGAVASYIEGCLVALERPDPPVESIRSALVKALAATLRAGEILRRVHQLGTGGPAEPGRFSLNQAVEEVEALLRDEAGRLGVALRLDLASDLPRLWGDPVQIQQVLVNLVRNALVAAVGTQTPPPMVVLTTRNLEHRAVEFGVTDNGAGIPADRIGRIFDPFFSTRAERMGMGLAISRTIVEAHRGRLGVESRPGVRTTFRFTLPTDDGVDDATDGLHRG
jgi:two-component system sensor kinase FixL